MPAPLARRPLRGWAGAATESQQRRPQGGGDRLGRAGRGDPLPAAGRLRGGAARLGGTGALVRRDRRPRGSASGGGGRGCASGGSAGAATATASGRQGRRRRRSRHGRGGGASPVAGVAATRRRIEERAGRWLASRARQRSNRSRRFRCCCWSASSRCNCSSPVAR